METRFLWVNTEPMEQLRENETLHAFEVVGFKGKIKFDTSKQRCNTTK